MFLEQKTILGLSVALKKSPIYQRAAGYTLLEVLISLCILSFGLLGFAQAQLLALRSNQIAYMQSIAQTRLTSLAEILQACAGVNCSSTDMNDEINSWNEDNAYLLPSGQSDFKTQDNYQMVTIHWQTTANNQAIAQAKLLMPIFHGKS